MALDRPGDRGGRPGQGCGQARALDRLDLTVRRRQVTGSFGPNGMGKTTHHRHVRLLDGHGRSQALDGPVQTRRRPLTLSALLATPADATGLGGPVGHATTRLADARVTVAEVAVGQPSLHEAFLALTDRPSSPVT